MMKGLGLFITVPVFFFILITHEIAHGYMALKLGDNTARDAGRLTFNPIVHIDPVGTVILPALLVFSRSPVIFGWARPVPVNPGNFAQPRKGMFLTSLAGPLSNFFIAGILGLIFRLLSPAPGSVMSVLCLSGVMIGLILGLFNILPVPPLDGSGMVSALLPDRLRRYYDRSGRYGFILIVLLLYLGLLEKVLIPLTSYFTGLLAGI